jgi:PIN domain nuclease of toxin-antitoxin system
MDTLVFLRWNSNDHALGRNLRDLIANPTHAVHVSAASVWEISIKRGLGNLSFEGSPSRAIGLNGFTPLAITHEDAVRARTLDWTHRDPFDRMLVAQCLNHRLTLCTADAVMQQRTDVPMLKVR